MKSRGVWTAVVLGALSLFARAEDLPAGYQQIVPPGAIPALDEPRFVLASRAGIPDKAWVLGVVVEGQARAYSLNLLNRHEIVNDRAGHTPFAAVW